MSHSHGPTNEKRTLWATVLTGGFMFAEIIGGLMAGSLALLADATHMLTDTASLALAYAAFRIARRPADWRRTYGFDRFQLLVAFANGLSLCFIAAWIVYEAVSRFFEPHDVLGGPMLIVAMGGLVINIVAYLMLRGGDRENLNLRGAMLHVLSDLVGSIAALAAALVILSTGWIPIDPLLSLVVALIILHSAWHLMAESAHVLLEGAPKGLDTRHIGPDLITHVPGVEDIHHVHAWSLTHEKTLVTLHARVFDDRYPGGVTALIKSRLRERFDIDHATIEIEQGRCADDHEA